MLDRRKRFRLGLHHLYIPLYDALCDELPDRWLPIGGLRTFIQQNDLYAQGRSKPGPVVTKAMGGLSLHNYGLASDWAYFEHDDYLNMDFADPRWEEYELACDKLGLRRIHWEKPHNEYSLQKCNVRLLYEAYNDWGMPGVEKLLEEETEHG